LLVELMLVETIARKKKKERDKDFFQTTQYNQDTHNTCTLTSTSVRTQIILL